MPNPRFISDNAAGVPPEVLAALAEANNGPALAYGDDPWTQRLIGLLRTTLGTPDAAVWPLWGGTGANVLALRAVTNRIDSVVCATSSHLVVAETGAPELTAGVSIVTIPSDDGKLNPERIEAALPERDGDHRPRPRVISVAQATERGTLYTPAELRALADFAHAHHMLLHVDGARLPAAAAALGCTFADLVGNAGVDLLSFGGTKAGLLGAEAVVFTNPALAPDAGRHRKQITQLASKQRYVSAQLLALLEHDRWRAWGEAANRAAALLADGLTALPGVRLAVPVQTNAVFVFLPAPAIAALEADWAFEVYSRRTGLVRFLCAWDVTDADVQALVDDVAAAAG